MGAGTFSWYSYTQACAVHYSRYVPCIRGRQLQLSLEEIKCKPMIHLVPGTVEPAEPLSNHVGGAVGPGQDMGRQFSCV